MGVSKFCTLGKKILELALTGEKSGAKFAFPERRLEEEMSKGENFTPNQVAAIVEDLKSEFKVVLDVVIPLRKDMVEVKERLSAVEGEVRSLKDVVVCSVLPRITRLETKVSL